MSTPLEENLEDRKTESLLKNSHMSHVAKPRKRRSGEVHRLAPGLTRHGAGRELADSSSTTTSTALHPDRHMVTVEKREGLFRGEREVRDNNGIDDEGSVGSSHRHWCTLGDYPNAIVSCDAWKRHEREHEIIYPCNMCGTKDSAFTKKVTFARRYNLVRHLSDYHGLSNDAASNLAVELRYTDIKKAYACGFCIRMFRTHPDQLNHIDQEHWRRGQNISEWDLNKVIHGLLLQPNIQSSWRNLLRDTSSVTRDLTWNTSDAGGLIRRLELSEEPADDLAAAAIAQLRPVHLFPSADSYGIPKDSTNRPRVEPLQRVADIASESFSDALSMESGVDYLFPSADSYWNPKDNINRPPIKPFQRIADVASDSSSDAQSVESGVDSVASSRTSVAPDKFSRLAADELVTCLLQNAELGVIYKAALESRHVGADRFERNFRRILNQYSRDLKKEARNRGQTSAAVLVRRWSRYIANTLRQKLEGPRRSYRPDHILHGEDLSNLNILKVEQYLRSMKGSLSSSSSDEPCIRDELLEELSGSDTDTSDDDLDDKLPELSQIKDFMFTSKAFLALRATVWQLVDHSLKLNLGRLTAEIECCRATPIDVSYEAVESISDRIKGVIEDFTRSSWDWWPLKPRMGHIPAGYARIRWYCSCGEERYENVPIFFAEQVARPSPYGAAQWYAVEGDGQGQTTSSRRPSHSTASSTMSNSRQSNQYTGRLTEHENSLKRKKRAVGYNTGTNSRTLVVSALYVFLGIGLGDENRLAQIEIINKEDDTFYEELKRSYNATKDILRRVFGIWKYAHCEFFKFEKFDDNDIAPRVVGVPPPENLEYEYAPKPVDSMPPITPHEFRRRYYSCRGNCPISRSSLLCYFHRCKKPCRLRLDAVDRIPKRTSRLELDGDARSSFWGLYAVERISFFKVAIYHSIVIIPSLIFMFLWLFHWGHPGDLQNASVPLLCGLALLSLLWFSAISIRGLQPSERWKSQ